MEENQIRQQKQVDATNHEFVSGSLEYRPCPKCKAQVKTNFSECPFCGIVFAKHRLDFVEGEIEFRGSSDLARSWDYVRDDYADETRHDFFIQRCHEENKLTYASHKYRMILEANPNEELARMMRKKILALATAKFEQQKHSDHEDNKVPKRISLFSLLMLLAGTFVVIGFSLPELRNLVGVGAAIIVLVGGFRLAFRHTT